MSRKTKFVEILKGLQYFSAEILKKKSVAIEQWNPHGKPREMSIAKSRQTTVAMARATFPSTCSLPMGQEGANG